MAKPKRGGEGYFPRVLSTLSRQEDSPMVLRTRKYLPGSPGDAALARRVQEQVELYPKSAPMQMRPNAEQLRHAISFAVQHDLTKKKKAAAAGRVCVRELPFMAIHIYISTALVHLPEKNAKRGEPLCKNGELSPRRVQNTTLKFLTNNQTLYLSRWRGCRARRRHAWHGCRRELQ